VCHGSRAMLEAKDWTVAEGTSVACLSPQKAYEAAVDRYAGYPYSFRVCALVMGSRKGCSSNGFSIWWRR
jgi:hypothetical protein